ncbi:MAG: hypothetical protein ACJAVW_003569 [Spirosomataceae bacterium]|jgi:hypothetical protein
MKQEERDLITAPVAGLVVWCTDCATEGELQVYNGAAWIKSGVAPGTAQGQMRYWDGTAWLVIAPGTEGQVLTFVSGEPTWKTTEGNTNVTNPTTGKIWMDRNLGATRVATSSTDAYAYGDLYQWGRATDGHTLRTSVAKPQR